MTMVSLLSIVTLSAQSVDEIIDKHIEAIGGKDVLTKTKSITAETSTSMMGNSSPGKLYILNGKGYKSEMEMMGQSVIQCVTLKGGWSTNPMNGGTPEAMPEAQHKSMLNNMSLGGIFLDYASKGFKVELKGKKNINKTEAYELHVSQNGGSVSKYYIDTQTYYIIRMESKAEMMGQEVDLVSNINNYQKLSNGYVMAHRIELELGGFSFSTEMSKVEVDKDIDEKVFDKP